MSNPQDANSIVPGEVQALIEAIKTIGGGALSQQAATKLSEAVKATVLLGKNSSVTIQLKIKKANEEMITIEGNTKATIPQAPISAGFFYSQQNYMPSRNRQDQMTIPFEDK